jgi:hypothetical protein
LRKAGCVKKILFPVILGGEHSVSILPDPRKEKRMKKPQAANLRSVRSEAVLKPSRLLMFLNYILLFTIAVTVGLGVRWLVNREGFGQNWWSENGLLTLAVVVFSSLLIAVVDHGRWTLRIINGSQLEGPTGALGDRLVIPLREIDMDRTRKSLRSRLKIGNGIYANSRQRILISPWFYRPAEYRNFIREIGL